MKAELTAEGILLIAQCSADETELDQLFEKGHVHLVCKARQKPTRKHGYKTKRGNVLLTASLADWKMKPLGKKHGTGDARRKRYEATPRRTEP